MKPTDQLLKSIAALTLVAFGSVSHAVSLKRFGANDRDTRVQLIVKSLRHQQMTRIEAVQAALLKCQFRSAWTLAQELPQAQRELIEADILAMSAVGRPDRDTPKADSSNDADAVGPAMTMPFDEREIWADELDGLSANATCVVDSPAKSDVWRVQARKKYQVYIKAQNPLDFWSAALASDVDLESWDDVKIINWNETSPYALRLHVLLQDDSSPRGQEKITLHGQRAEVTEVVLGAYEFQPHALEIPWIVDLQAAAATDVKSTQPGVMK